MWINNRFISSIFSSRLGDSGVLMRMSIKSKKLTNTEWFNFLNSFFRSMSLAEYNLLNPYKYKNANNFLNTYGGGVSIPVTLRIE